jgi:hypothetical protein
LIIIGVWKCESLIARCWDKIVCIKKFHLDCICPIVQAPNILERVNSTSAVVFIISIHTKNSFILMLFLNTQYYKLTFLISVMLKKSPLVSIENLKYRYK